MSEKKRKVVVTGACGKIAGQVEGVAQSKDDGGEVVDLLAGRDEQPADRGYGVRFGARAPVRLDRLPDRVEQPFGFGLIARFAHGEDQVVETEPAD